MARDPSSNPRADTIFFNFLYITAGFQNKPTVITNITVGLFSSMLVFWNRQWCLYILKNSFIYWINRSICISMLKWLEIFLTSVYTQIKIPHRILGFSNHFINYIFSVCWIRQKRVNFILDSIDFFIHLYKILIPRAH